MTSEKSKQDQLLDEAVVEYLEAAEAGQPFDTAEWLARYPSLKDELQQFLGDQSQVKRWTEPLQQFANTVSIGSGVDESSLEKIDAAPVDALPFTMGDYEVISEVARGGMGVVYRARQLSLNRVVALKMILSGELASSAELARFRTEAEAFASLDHANIMPIYEVGIHESRPFFSMKLIEGGNLTSQLDRFAGDGRSIAQLMATVARAVHHAHQRGILHRDLKPDNILIDSEGQPFVTDFGLARRVQGDSGMTQSGAILGTPSYMAPEQAAGKRDLTTAVDVYGLGAVLYVLLSGSPPFRGETPVETVRQVLDEEPSRPRMLNPAIHRDLETICMKCLEKNPERRYSSSEAFLEDLERWLRNEPIRARRASIWERAIKKARRSPAAAALVLLSTLTIVGIISGTLYVRQSHWEAEAKITQRINDTEEDIEELLNTARQHENSQEWVLAQGVLKEAMGQAGSEPRLAGLLIEANRRLNSVSERIDQQKARRHAREQHGQFLDLYHRVLFEGTLYAGRDRAAVATTTLKYGEQALAIFGLDTEGGGIFEVSPHLDDQKQVIADHCYEILLIVAEAAWQKTSSPTVPLKLLDQAADLRAPTRTYYTRQARYAAADSSIEQTVSMPHELPPSVAFDHFLGGLDLLNTNDSGAAETAVVEFESALHLQPNHFWSQYLAGLCRLPKHPFAARAYFTDCLHKDQGIAAWIHLYRAVANLAIAVQQAGDTAPQPNLLKEAEDDLAMAESLSKEMTRQRDLRFNVHFHRATLRQTQGTTAEAIEELERARQLKDDSYLPLERLASLLEKTNRVDEAERALATAIRLANEKVYAQQLESSELVRLLYRRARLRFKHRREGVADDLHAANAIRPTAEAYELLAQHCSRIESWKSALEAVHAALNSSPLQAGFDNSTLLGLQAECFVILLQQTESSEARLPLQTEAGKALDLYLANAREPDAQFYRLRGLLRTQTGDYSGAANDFTCALNFGSAATDLANSLTLTYRGWAYTFARAHELALADFTRALELEPGNADAYRGRGYSLALRGQHAEAVKDIETLMDRLQEPPDFQQLWTAACVHALATRAMDKRRGYKYFDPALRAHYFTRTMTLIQQAMSTVSASDASQEWQRRFAGDEAFAGVRSSPEFRRLHQAYLPGDA